MRALNRHLVWDFDEADKRHVQALGDEMIAACLLDALLAVRSEILRSSHMPGMLEPLLLALYVVRTVGARLADVSPECSRDLSGISVQLGSIVADVAILTGAKLDMGHSNAAASVFLDKIKMSSESRLGKQYSNLNASELYCRCY